MDVDFGDVQNSGGNSGGGGGGGGGGDDITSDLLQKFSCMNTNDREVLIQQFKVLLGEKCSESNAEFWLDMNNWNLQAAVCSYFDYDSQNSAYPYPIKLPSMSFISDGNFADRMPPNTPFVYQCVVTNSGDEPWPLGCSLRFTGGTQMSGEERVLLPSLNPGQSAEVKLSMISPDSTGGHQCQWRPATLTGQFFGETIFIIVNVFDDAILQSVTQQLSDAHLMDSDNAGPSALPSLPLTSSTVIPLGTTNSPQSDWDNLVVSTSSFAASSNIIYPLPAPNSFTAGMCVPGSTAAGYLPNDGHFSGPQQAPVGSPQLGSPLQNGSIFSAASAQMQQQQQQYPNHQSPPQTQLMLTHLSQPPAPPASNHHHHESLDDSSMS